jgi:hypothetical protein
MCFLSVAPLPEQAICGFGQAFNAGPMIGFLKLLEVGFGTFDGVGEG